MTRARMLDHALRYAAMGWPVLPCDPRDKRPHVAGGVDLASNTKTGGWHKATCDERQIREWWTRWPTAMIAVPMGGRSGVWAFDLDLGDPSLISGEDYLQRFVEHVGGFDHTAIARTPSGGIHVYFRWNDTRPVRRSIKSALKALAIAQPDGAVAANGKRAKDAGVDVCGEGGYVIVPPSVREDGAAYEWLQVPEDGIAAATDALFGIGAHTANARPASQRLAASTPREPRPATAANDKARRYALAALESERREVSRARPGERNALLFRACLKLGELLAAGALSEREISAGMEDAAEGCGLAADDGWRSVSNTIHSGLTKTRDKPRDLRQLGGVHTDIRAAALRPARNAGDPASTDHAMGASPRELDRELSRFPLTDRGNAQRFEARNRGRFAYCPSEDWLRWDGSRWCLDGDRLAVLSAVHKMVEALNREADVVRDEES